MKALLAVFGEAFGDPETYGGAVPSDAYLEQLLAKKWKNSSGPEAKYTSGSCGVEDTPPSRDRHLGSMNWDALVPRAAPMSYSFKPTTVTMRQSRFTPRLGSREDVLHFDIALHD
jgi:hypothetical protein